MTFDLKIGNSSFVQTNTEQSSSNYCPDEIVIKIFMRCVCIEGDIQGAKAFSLTNRHIYNVIVQYMSGLDLRVVCPKLTILDAKALGCEVDDEPFITRNMKCQVMKCYQNMVPYVEGDLGLTLLTMPKGCSVYSLHEEGQELLGTDRCDIDPAILNRIGDATVEKTYRILITKNIFNNSRRQSFEKNIELTLTIGCEVPTVLEMMTVCIWTYKVSQKFLYSQAGTTYGLTSSMIDRDWQGAMTMGTAVGCYLKDGQPTVFVCDSIRNGSSDSSGVGGKVNL